MTTRGLIRLAFAAWAVVLMPGVLSIWSWGASAEVAPASARPSVVRIEKRDGGWRLLRNGEPYFVKGAVVGPGGSLDMLKQAGANSIRTHAGMLDEAQRRGFTALAGLPLGNPRHGFDYADTNRVRVYYIGNSVTDTVRYGELAQLAAVGGVKLDWGPSGVDVAIQGEAVLETFCKEPGKYDWVGGASYVAECLLTGSPSLITPEHGLHVLEVMNACHESQQTGRRVTVESTFPWPIIKA